jgi:hypothetical protein
VLQIVLAYNVIVCINIYFYSCYVQYLSKKFSKPTSGRPNGLNADPGPLGMFLFSPMFLMVSVYNIIVYHNIDFYSYYVQYSSNQFFKPTSGSPDGLDADAVPPAMLLNIPTCALDCVGLQCNCPYQY